MAGAFSTFILDQWTPLSHKVAIGDHNGAATSPLAPVWTGHHRRRLMAYIVLHAYLNNAARHFLHPVAQQDTLDDEDEHREYGDAGLLVSQIKAALIGDEQAIVVPLAAEEPPDPNDPAETSENAEDTDEAVTAEQIAHAQQREDWLRQWADDERFFLKLHETESNAIGLGDGVYVLGWSAKKKRARLRSYDPGFYFPVLGDDDEDDFPGKVHLAWEVQEDDDGNLSEVTPGEPAPTGSQGPRLVRRITYELVDAPGVAYPWNDPDEPSAVTCHMTDAVYRLESNARVQDFAAPLRFLQNEDGTDVDELDLGIDFIPVVHIPNKYSSAHWGSSALLLVAQLLDDLANADTDMAIAANVVGTPPIAVTGVSMPADTGSSDGRSVNTYGPGQVFNLGPEGRMDVLDTSKSLDALAAHTDRLLERLSVNSRVPASVLGRLTSGGNQANESGVHLALRFGPLESLIGELRLVRDVKYPLLLKMVQRFAIVAGELDAGDTERAELQFGAYLPADKAAVVSQVKELLVGKAISRRTAVDWLVEAGFKVGDAVDEVERIEREDFAGAGLLLDATGDEDAVFEYLHRDRPAVVPPPPAPPTPPVPPAPGPGPQPEPVPPV